jgi:hypothetical protein
MLVPLFREATLAGAEMLNFIKKHTAILMPDK